MTMYYRRKMTEFLLNYFKLKEGETKETVLKEQDILECLNTLILEGVFQTERELQVEIVRKVSLILPNTILEDAIYGRRNE